MNHNQKKDKVTHPDNFPGVWGGYENFSKGEWGVPPWCSCRPKEGTVGALTITKPRFIQQVTLGSSDNNRSYQLSYQIFVYTFSPLVNTSGDREDRILEEAKFLYYVPYVRKFGIILESDWPATLGFEYKGVLLTA